LPNKITYVFIAAYNHLAVATQNTFIHRS